VALTWRERSLSDGVKGERPSLLPRLAEAHRDLARALRWTTNGVSVRHHIDT